jgi:hypothetical protein
MVLSPRVHRWSALVAGTMVVGGLLFWFAAPRVVPVAPRSAPTPPPALVLSAAPERPMPRALNAPSHVAPLVAESPLPPGVDAVQWAHLQGELRDRPAELRRVADYLVWSDALGRFRAARTSGADRSTLAALAGAVDAGLTDRLQNREVSAAEARSVKLALLDATVSDATQREERLAQWISERPAGAFTATTPDPRQAEFNRRQAALLATQRDPQALARELDALRASVFAAARR